MPTFLHGCWQSDLVPHVLFKHFTEQAITPVLHNFHWQISRASSRRSNHENRVPQCICKPACSLPLLVHTELFLLLVFCLRSLEAVRGSKVFRPLALTPRSVFSPPSLSFFLPQRPHGYICHCAGGSHGDICSSPLCQNTFSLAASHLTLLPLDPFQTVVFKDSQVKGEGVVGWRVRR